MKELLYETIKNDPTWQGCLPFFTNPHTTVHIAVMVEPFLSALLNGQKTIESRFSKNKIAPYQKVKPGDLVLLKQSSGPIVASFEVSTVQYSELTKNTLKQIEQSYKNKIGGSSEFWQTLKSKKYASLFGISNVQTHAPVTIKKRDPRGWVVLI